jgi:hypothetical protein
VLPRIKLTPQDQFFDGVQSLLECSIVYRSMELNIDEANDHAELRQSFHRNPGMQYRTALEAIEWLCKGCSASPNTPSTQAKTTPSRRGNAQHQHPRRRCRQSLRHAKSAGPEMIFDIQDKFYGGRDFACRDPERCIWHVGTYNPWAAK